MNYLYMRRFLLFMFFTLFLIVTCNAQFSHKSSPKNAEKALFGKSRGNTRKAKSKEPRSLLKAERAQEKNEKRLKKEGSDDDIPRILESQGDEKHSGGTACALQGRHVGFKKYIKIYC